MGLVDEGYRLTYGGYDFLACRTFAKRDTIYSVGNQIGTGKESGKFLKSWPMQGLSKKRDTHACICRLCRMIDIYVVADDDGAQSVMKIHRYAFPFPPLEPLLTWNHTLP